MSNRQAVSNKTKARQDSLAEMKKVIGGTSQHSVIFDVDLANKQKVSLARHNNGKTKFMLVHEMNTIETQLLAQIGVFACQTALVSNPARFTTLTFIAALVGAHASAHQSAKSQKLKLGLDPISIMLQSFNDKDL